MFKPTAQRLLTVFVLLMGLTLPVFTDQQVSYAGTLDDQGVYTSSYGYEITPPEDWQYVDRGNHAVKKDQLPAELQRPTPDAYDVVFFDGELEPEDGKPTPIFDNIVIVVVPSIPEIDDKLGETLAKGIKPHLDKLFAEVKLVETRQATHGEAKSIDLEWQISDEDGARNGYIIQSVLPGVNRTVMVTCTIGSERWDGRKDACLSVLDSIKLNDK